MKQYLVYKHANWQQWMTLEELKAFATHCVERYVELGGEAEWSPLQECEYPTALALRGYTLLEVIPPYVKG